MTAKERARVYRRAAGLLFKRPKYSHTGICSWGDEKYRGCCSAVLEAAQVPQLHLSQFPELEIFKRNSEGVYWWADSAESIQPRILALLLCEQMALNP